MAAENNYEEILEEVCKKLSNLDSIKEVDVINIKSSVESIENLITDTQAKLNFQDIKEKLENISFQVGSCNEALLKSLYNDINALKTTTSNVGESIEAIQEAQNLALTTAEFEEYQKQQLDLVIRTNENIFNELSAIKQNSGTIESNPENVKRLEAQMENLHKSLTGYITQLVSRIAASPNLDEIGAVVADLNSIQQKSIHQTNVMLKELQDRFSVLEDNIVSSDIENQLSKISEIYNSLNLINSWIEKVGYINQAIENVYARLGESIDFDEVADKVDIIYENVGALNSWMNKIDNIDRSLPEVQNKILTLGEFIEDAKNINETINAIKDKVDAHLVDELDLNDVSEKMDIVYENLSALNEWAIRLDEVSEKVSDINDDVSKQISEIKDDVKGQISEVQDNVSKRISEMRDGVKEQISETKNNITKQISEIKDGVNEQISSVKEDIDSSSMKATLLSSKMDDLSEQMLEVIKNINEADKGEALTLKLNVISEQITNLNDEISEDFRKDEINFKLEELSSSIKDLRQDIDDISLAERLDIISDRIIDINKLIENNDIISKIDVIYDNLSLLNDWVNRIDELKKQNDDFSNKYTAESEELNTHINDISENINSKINEVSETLSHASKLIEDVPNIKDKLDELSGELKAITGAGENNAESAAYSLLNIESDFSRIQQILDYNAKSTADEINQIKERFAEINEDISSISIRTNKLILSADDANKQFKLYLESFKDTIDVLKNQSEKFNPEMKFAILSEKTTEMIGLLQKSVIANTNLNNAFVYLAEWIDATGSVLNSMQTDLTEIKANSTANVDEISEIKSLLTGVIVQLNTALTPDINTANEKIDKIAEENKDGLERIENLIQEKSADKTRSINELENKINALDSKFDRILEVLNENSNNYEVKNILNYMATQISGVNESLSTQSFLSEKVVSVDTKINEVDEKVAAVDNKINEVDEKVVSVDTKINEFDEKVLSSIEKINTFEETLAKVMSFIEDNRQNKTVINDLAARLDNFDSNINKIVSYIEED